LFGINDSVHLKIIRKRYYPKEIESIDFTVDNSLLNKGDQAV